MIRKLTWLFTMYQRLWLCGLVYLILTLWGRYCSYFNYRWWNWAEEDQVSWGPISGTWWRQRAIRLQSLCSPHEALLLALCLSLDLAFASDRSPDGSVTTLTPSPHHPHLQIREVEAKGGGISNIYRAHQHQCVGWMGNRTGQRPDDCAHGLSDEEGSWNRERGVACRLECKIWGYAGWLSLGVKGWSRKTRQRESRDLLLELVWWEGWAQMGIVHLGGTGAFERGDAESFLFCFFRLEGNVLFRITGQCFRGVFRYGNLDSGIILILQASCIFSYTRIHSWVSVACVWFYRFL